MCLGVHPLVSLWLLKSLIAGCVHEDWWMSLVAFNLDLQFMLQPKKGGHVRESHPSR